jgi:tRNA/tmRNA/rRNA uracil-C5-methylase (TrmA/RlmC/RlmD family)
MQPNKIIRAINPLNYRTVVSFNFDKITNQQFWDKRILELYNLIMTIKIDSIFIGLRININDDDEFMLKLNVMEIDFEKMKSFYETVKKFGDIISFYYEYKEKIFHLHGTDSLTIFINKLGIEITPNSFIQANHEMGNILYSKISTCVNPNEKLIVYGRNSFHIALGLHTKFKQITCINPCEIAYNDGLKLIKTHKLNWNTIHSKEALVTSINESDDNTTIIMSPGRSGYAYFDKINLDQLKKKQVLYITCNEESLKNDIKDNFIIKNNIMIELFPGTQFNEHIIELESS